MKNFFFLSFLALAVGCAPAKTETAAQEPPAREERLSWQEEHVIAASVIVRDVYTDDTTKTFVFDGEKSQKFIAALKLGRLERRATPSSIQTGELALTLKIDGDVYTEQFNILGNLLMYKIDPEDGYLSDTYITAEFLQRFDETN